MLEGVVADLVPYPVRPCPLKAHVPSGIQGCSRKVREDSGVDDGGNGIESGRRHDDGNVGGCGARGVVVVREYGRGKL
jgi:hypothetical protein